MLSRILLAAAVGALASTLVFTRATDDLPKLHFPDAFHYAELGRQLARGEGFTSLQTHPYVLAWMKHAGLSPDPPWPNVARFPLITMLYAPVYVVAGATESATLAVGSTFHVLTAMLAFLLGARLFGVGVGVVAGVVCAANATQVAFARSGLLETPAAFFLLATTLVLATLHEQADPRRAGRLAVLLGLLLGLAFLLRHDLLALSVAAVPVLLLGRGVRGRRDLFWTLVAAALPVALWMLRNAWTTGSPFVFLGFDRNVLGGRGLDDPYAATAYRGVWEALASQPQILIAKLGDLLWPLRSWRHLFGWKLELLVPCFVASCGVLLALRHRALRVLAFVVIAFALRALIFTLTHHERRFYLSFAPLALVFALGGAWAFLAAVFRPLRGARVELALGIALAALYVLVQPVPRGPAGRPLAHRPAPLDETLVELRRRTPPGTTIATLRPEAVAWYGERPAVRAPAEQLSALDALGARIDGLLYGTGSTPGVRRALQRQGLEGEFVPVHEGTTSTLWLRPLLVRRWNDAAAGAVEAADQAG